MDRSSVAGSLHDWLTDDEEGRLCKDIPEQACRHQPQNFLLHVASLTATKIGDGLADPKLVLAWLLGALGAPAAAVGLLVPVRESLALLPQLFISSRIRSLPLRKWAWAFGSIVQGLAVLGMALVATTSKGATAGWSIVGLLCVFALARSVCSVSYKDVLGKTVAKQSRGTATGTAASAAAIVVLMFGVLIGTGIVAPSVNAIAVALVVAGTLWLAAGTLFLRIKEEAGATDGATDGDMSIKGHLSLLRQDGQLARFIATRGLLTATALAPPFLLALAGQSSDQSLGALGPFVVASSLASVLSGYVWGRFADRSSRWVLIVSAATAGLILSAVALMAFAWPALTSVTWLMSLTLFFLMVSYKGVRLGRSTHLVDMADQDNRAAYTAISNTAIGVLLLAGGAFGFIADMFGVAVVLVLFALMCFAAVIVARGLEDVQAK